MRDSQSHAALLEREGSSVETARRSRPDAEEAQTAPRGGVAGQPAISECGDVRDGGRGMRHNYVIPSVGRDLGLRAVHNGDSCPPSAEVPRYARNDKIAL